MLNDWSRYDQKSATSKLQDLLFDFPQHTIKKHSEILWATQKSHPSSHYSTLNCDLCIHHNACQNNSTGLVCMLFSPQVCGRYTECGEYGDILLGAAWGSPLSGSLVWWHFASVPEGSVMGSSRVTAAPNQHLQRSVFFSLKTIRSGWNMFLVPIQPRSHQGTC